METILLLLATIVLLSLLIARPFVKGAYRIPVTNTVLNARLLLARHIKLHQNLIDADQTCMGF